MTRGLALIILVALCACSRPPEHSPEYAQARELWTRLVLARGVDAADDPQAAEVLGLLARVPPASADARDAAELAARVEAERKASADERARREKLVARAAQPTALPSPARAPQAGSAATASGGAAPAPLPATGSAAGGASAGEPAAGDAPRAEGAPKPLPALEPGLPLDAFKDAYGDCFEERGPVMVDAPGGGAPRASVMWGMKDLIACRERLPQLSGQLALFTGGKLLGLGSKERLRTERRQVELGTLPDGKVGVKVGEQVVPLPEGAVLEKPAEGKR